MNRGFGCLLRGCLALQSLLACTAGIVLAREPPAQGTWTDLSPHKEGFVTANGIRLQYLDWGGAGPALILIHGLGSNPHVFDDLAPALNDRFHVIAYAVRGHGRSDAKPPYDMNTRREDLRGLMDALGIQKAHLAGWSMGGMEVTAMASRYADRVGRLIYLDSYRYTGPAFEAVSNAIPASLVDVPPAAMTSLDAYLSFEKARNFGSLDDIGRIEASLREAVIIQPDGSVKWRMSKAVREAFNIAQSPDLSKEAPVRASALAIYAQSAFDLQAAEAPRREAALRFEHHTMAPFRAQSIEYFRERLRQVKFLSVPGAHGNFFLISRERVVAAIREFLSDAAPALTVEDYARAERFLPGNANALILNEEVKPHWIDRGSRICYRSESRDGATFKIIDPKRNTSKRVASCLAPAANESATEVVSPDGKRMVFARAHNLYLKDLHTGQTSALTHDGEEGNGYEIGELDTSVVTGLQLAKKPAAFFSPDSSKLLAFRSDLRKVGTLSLSETLPGGLPRLHSYRYPVAGAKEIGHSTPMVLDLQHGTRTELQCPPLPMASLISTLWYPGQTQWGETIPWNASGTQVYFLHEERGYKATTVYRADTRTGKIQALLTERSTTYVNRNPILRVVGDGAALIWSSERSGWNHLYLINGETGAVENAITTGAWAVRDVLYVDTRNRWVYFTAGGREEGRDPYLRHLYRVKLDGTALQLLTPENADHKISFAPTGEYFTDTYSRVDLAPVSLVRAADGKLARVLEVADISALQAMGWHFPEPFHALARDGKTAIYGVIFRPTHFDPNKSYPVIDAIYPGPQVTRVTKRLSFSGAGVHSGGFDQALAELGFVVVTVDGMGTPYRSKAFREVSYGNLGDAGGLADHIAAIKQLGERYSYLDLGRIGIWGISAGGYAAARAILRYPDFYKVAVSLSGAHDLRGFWAEWGERFQGYPVDDEKYEQQANAPLAAGLRGKLLLAYGALDDVVHPSQTLGLADSLIASNKDFDLLVFPNRSHALIDLGQDKHSPKILDLYFVRRFWDYFVKNLAGVDPPQEYQIGIAP